MVDLVFLAGEAVGDTDGPSGWVGWLTIAGFAGLVTAAINQGIEALRERWARTHESKLQAAERDHREKLQTSDARHQQAERSAERDHQRLMRDDENHFAAAAEHAKSAWLCREWLNYRALDLHGPEVDFHPIATRSNKVGGPAGLVERLSRIRGLHPTAEVRELSGRIAEAVANFYNELSGDGQSREEPDLDQMLEWLRGLDELIELIHSPFRDIEARR